MEKSAHYIGKSYLDIGTARDIKKRSARTFYRFLEILPGFLSWGTIIGLIVLSYFVPTFVAIFVIIFDVYWLAKSVMFSIHLFSSYFEIKKRTKINWLQKLEKEHDDSYLEYYHLIILPTYKESYELIKATFESIVACNYPHNKFIVVLAIEEAAGEQGKEIANKIKKEYGERFFKFLITEHPSNLEGEIAGKGSNERWSGKQAKKEIIDVHGISYENVIVSVFDIDTRPFKDYFGVLMHEFLRQDNPHNASYQPIPVFHNNVWQLPAFSRIVAFSTTFWQMMQQKRAHKLATFSSHSMSLKSLVDMDFWQPNVVSEDSRIFWKSLMFFDGDYRVVPLFYPVSMDAILGKNFWDTAKNQYKQQRRWAYGSENIPYIIFGFNKNKKVPLSKKLYFSLIQIEGFWSWATSAVIITFLGWLPILLGGEKFTSTVLSYNLPTITSNLMILAMIGLVASAAVSTLLLPAPPKTFKKWKHIFLLLEWLLIPITVNVFGVVPSLDAQTRLMLGRYMGFWVTPKAPTSSPPEKS